MASLSCLTVHAVTLTYRGSQYATCDQASCTGSHHPNGRLVVTEPLQGFLHGKKVPFLPLHASCVSTVKNITHCDCIHVPHVKVGGEMG